MHSITPGTIIAIELKMRIFVISDKNLQAKFEGVDCRRVHVNKHDVVAKEATRHPKRHLRCSCDRPENAGFRVVVTDNILKVVWH